MKREKELLWLSIIGTSKICKDTMNFRINPIPMNKNEISCILGVSINDKYFNSWVNQLIEKNVLIYYGKKSNGRGKLSMAYTTNIKEILRYISEDNNLNEMYNKIYAFMNLDRVI